MPIEPGVFIETATEDMVVDPNMQSGKESIKSIIINAVIFLSLVAVYNALFTIWETLLGASNVDTTQETDDLREGDELKVRVTFAIFIVFGATLIVSAYYWGYLPTSF